MKRAFLSLFMLPGLLAMVSLASAQNGVQKKHERPVYASFPKELSLEEGSKVRVEVEVEGIQAGMEYVIVPTELGEVEVLHTGRAVCRTDGRVDVDIIIRNIIVDQIDLIPGVVVIPPKTPVHLFDIEIITVDNISGIKQSDNTPTQGSELAKISSFEITHVSGSDLYSPANNPASIGEGNQTHNQLTSRPVFESVPSGDISLYPVPVMDGNLNVSVPAGFGRIHSASIHNMLGARVKQISPSVNGGLMQISTSELSQGVYFLRMKTDAGEVVKKFNIGK